MSPTSSPPLDGACVGYPTQWWFQRIERGNSKGKVTQYRVRSAKAKEICGTCAKQKECLEYALHHEPLGIWGGLAEGERALLRRKRRIYASRGEPVFIPGVGTRSSQGRRSNEKP
jgi:hypothetical protein